MGSHRRDTGSLTLTLSSGLERANNLLGTGVHPTSQQRGLAGSELNRRSTTFRKLFALSSPLEREG